MPRTVTIPLDKPLLGHEGPITKVVVREPTFDEYLDTGEPFFVEVAPQSGVPFIVEDKQAMAAYCRMLIVEPKDPLLVAQGGMALAQKIKTAVKGFFYPAAEGGAGTRSSPTSSSSSPARTPAP